MIKVKTFGIALGLSVGLAGIAFADTWSVAYSGTILVTYASGAVVKAYVNADHTYSVGLPNGQTAKGTWADANGQSCFTQTEPTPPVGTAALCFPIKEYKVGDTTSGSDANGTFTTVITASR